MKYQPLIPLSLILLWMPFAPVQALKIEELNNENQFSIKMPGAHREFVGRAGAVNSISIHGYYTRSYIVTEVVVDMHGSPLQLRLYHTEVINPEGEAQAAEEASGSQAFGVPRTQITQTIQKRTTDNLQDARGSLVYKQYPTTTHAKTIEYHIPNKGELTAFYTSFRDAWTKENQGGSAQDKQEANRTGDQRENVNDTNTGASAKIQGSDMSTGNSPSSLTSIRGKVFVLEK